MSRAGWLLLPLLVSSSLGAQPDKAPQPSKAVVSAPKAIRAEPALTGPTWDGPQFVRADRKGKIFLFRGNTFDVYPQAPDGALADPVRLEATAERPTMVHDAVLNPAGDQWLVYADVGARLFVNGKEKTLPGLRWRPGSIAFLGNTPLLAVVPIPVGGFPLDLEDLSEIPWLYSLGNGRWETVVHQRNLSGKNLAQARRDNKDVVADSAVFMSADHSGKLWVGRQYAYRVERWSPSGRVLDEIVVDGGRVEEKKDRVAGKSSLPKGYHRFTAKPAVRDLVEGTDHRMYFLVTLPDGALALDRYDPALAVLERVPLQTMEKSSRFTLAAGKDALYLAAWNGRDGRWRITWEALEGADWQKVDGFEARATADTRPGG